MGDRPLFQRVRLVGVNRVKVWVRVKVRIKVRGWTVGIDGMNRMYLFAQ